MALLRSNNRNETFEQWRQRMLDDTARFIEWGLKNPDKVERIPMVPVSSRMRFSDRLRETFWSIVLRNPDMPD